MRKLTALLVADIALLLYFNVIRADYYYPDRYEVALQVTLLGLVAGVIILAMIAWRFLASKRCSDVTKNSR